jgi:hypothetical protein
MRFKKNGTLAVAERALRLLHQRLDEIKRSGELPDRAQYTFDELDRMTNDPRNDPQEMPGTAPGNVVKTARRTVVTLKYGTFEARKVVRQTNTQAGRGLVHNSELAQLVAPGCQYGYDVVAHVGLESFLFGRRAEEIAENLKRDSPSISIPSSTHDELRRRFLFYVGQVHRQAAPALREALHGPEGPTWLIDGTVEPGTPVFFGVQEARSGILLGCRKIPTENADDMVPCLKEVEQAYGKPQRILHDLSSAMSLACETACGGVSHDVCHYHFARDVGEGLLAQPQQKIDSRLGALKLRARLREQRKTQTQWLREHAGAPEATLVLHRLLGGEKFTVDWNQTLGLGREVLLAFHFWMLDYAADGRRQGFPFDAYSLYFHRRITQANDALARLLARPVVATQSPKTLWNLRDQLQRYCQDGQVIEAAAHYEKAYHEFHRLRTILRLSAEGPSPMRDAYQLTTDQEHQARESLASLCDEHRQRIEACSDKVERDVCSVVLSHVEKYLPQLLPRNRSSDGTRTTNQLEGFWGEGKRGLRHTQGCRKLTRSFNALPAELMLIPNLRNPEYINIVLDGSLDSLAAKFAEANVHSSSYVTWRKKNTSLNLGRIPSRILRKEDFVDQLTRIYDKQCHAHNKEAA